MYSGNFEGVADAIHESQKQLGHLRQVDPYPWLYRRHPLPNSLPRKDSSWERTAGSNLNRPLEAAFPLQEAFQSSRTIRQKELQTITRSPLPVGRGRAYYLD